MGYSYGVSHVEKNLSEYLGLGEYEQFREASVKNRACGIRLVMPYDSIDSIPNNGKPPVRAEDGVLEVEYGYLPRDLINNDLENKLDNLDKKGKLIETPYEYTTDGRSYNGSIDERPFLECKNKVYEYNGKFYAKVYNAIDRGDKERYSWKSVNSVKWWIDEEAKLMITEAIVYGGLEFRDIDMFIDKYLSNELDQIKERDEIEIRQKYEPSFWDKILPKKNKVRGLPEGTIEIEHPEADAEPKLIYENEREEQFEKSQYLEERIKQAVNASQKVAKTETNVTPPKINPIEGKVNNIILGAQINKTRTVRTYYVKGEDGKLYPTGDLNNSDYYMGLDGVLRPTKEPIENHQGNSAPTNDKYVAEPKGKNIIPEDQDDGNER